MVSKTYVTSWTWIWMRPIHPPTRSAPSMSSAITRASLSAVLKKSWIAQSASRAVVAVRMRIMSERLPPAAACVTRGSSSPNSSGRDPVGVRQFRRASNVCDAIS